MNKHELITAIATKAGISKAQTEKVLNATLEAIIEGVKKDKILQLIGFGTFKQKDKPERKGHNPKTKAPIVIPARKTVTFKVGTAFLEEVKK